ncbi:MAG: hypothetical protein HY775_11610 [Acidobacteria bacterium]|nr:hypothetical protein [Acidobacteriota bacterium]
MPGCIGPKDISLAVSKPSGSAFGVNYSSSGALTYAASGVTLVPDLWLHYLQMDFVARKVGCTGSFWDAYYNRLCADGAIWLDTTPPGFGPSSGALTGTASLGGYSQRFPSGFWAHDRYAWFRVHANFGGDNIDFQAGGSGSASCPTGTTLGETKYFASNGSRYRFMTSALCGSLGEYPLPDGT